jgi:hypothetical protein
MVVTGPGMEMMRTTMNEDILAAFDRMTDQVTNAYAMAREALAANELVRAQAILAQIGRSHAKSSVSLRNVLVRRGLLPGEGE